VVKRAPATVHGDCAAVRAAIADAGAVRVVLANGCFDPMHVGHARYLADAAAHGDYLVVAVNDDVGTRRIKGEGRPVVPAPDRAMLVAALWCVDAVLLFPDDTVERLLREIRPAVHAKGTDYTTETVPEREIARELGIETVIAGDPKMHASREVVARVRRAVQSGPPGPARE
jgi:rfaE bifunctional protein nucleotidyltransferase chain/domain